MFADTDFHLCVLTPDPIAEGTNQYTVYHRVSSSKLLLSELIKVFCISRSFFILRKTISILWATLYLENEQFEFRGSTTA